MKELGISSGVVTKWNTEGTLPNLKTAMDIADYFDVSLDYLANGKDSSGSELSENQQDILAQFDKLPEKHQWELIGYAKRMVEEIAAKNSVPEEEEVHDPPGGVAGN